MNAILQDLKHRFLEINNLRATTALLQWDQSTYLPPGGAPARARQLATLSRLAHERLTDPAIGKLLDHLERSADQVPPDSADAALLRVAREEYDRAVKVPVAFMAELTSHMAASYAAWAAARPANDFAGVRPYLEKTVELSRRYAEFFPGYEHIADPLIHESDRGMKAATIKALFAELRAQLVPIVRAIVEQPVADASCLKQYYPEHKQLAFGEEVIKQFGFDFTRGRQDKTLHPFMTKFSLGDVRITTRVKEHDLSEALFSTMHESGHAMYEQGICQDFEGSPLADGVSAGVHESQSRLWENLVGRSWNFWTYFYPRLQKVFPQQLGTVPLETFYRAINRVERSLIRTDADEVTYNLHVMMRFDFELDLLEGRLAVRDLPEAWRERFKADLGIAPPDDRDGVLQDVHWFSDFVGGAFQGYTIGNVLSAQFFDAALKAHPTISDEIGNGQFGTLHGWLREHIYQHGARYSVAELVQRATGSPLSIEPYIRYLRTKYGELYNL